MQGNLHHLQLRHFRLVQAIAATGQLSLAADRLAMTQPAASRSLGEAEAMVGGPLFDRHPKGMTPTPLGEVLARRGGVLLGEIEQAASEVDAVQTGRAGTVRVGAVTGAAVNYIAPAITDLKRETRDPEVRVDVAPSVQLMEDLLSGELDFIVSRVPPGVHGNRLDILHGRVESLQFLVRKGHPLLAQRNLGLESLTGFPWIIQMRGMPIREAVEAAHIAAGLALPSDVIDSASLLMMLAYLQSSDAISPVASEVSDLLNQTEAGGLRVLHMSDEITLSPYHLIRQKGRPLGPVANRLLDLVLMKLTG